MDVAFGPLEGRGVLIVGLGEPIDGGPQAVRRGEAGAAERAAAENAKPGIRQVSDNPAFASVSPIRKPARICP